MGLYKSLIYSKWYIHYQIVTRYFKWSLHSQTDPYILKLHSICALFKGLCVNAMIRSLCWGFSGWKFSVFISVTYMHTRPWEKPVPQQVNRSFNDNLSRAISLQTHSLLYTYSHSHISVKKKDLEHTVTAEANKGLAHCRWASYSRRQYKHQPGSGVTRVGGQGTESTLWEVRANKQAIKAPLLTAKY